MSTNCLVKKLKGSVDNDGLTKLGEIRFKFGGIGGSCILYSPSGTTVKINTIGDGLFTCNNTEHLSSYTHPGGSNSCNIVPENENLTISVISKYTISRLQLIRCDINMYDLANTNMTRLELNNCVLSKNISIDTIIKNLPNLDIISFSGTNNISGDVADFAPLINLTRLNIGTNNQVSGDLLNFATRQIVAGRTPASIASAWNGNLKFNGENIPNTNDNTLSWEQSGDNYVVTMNAGPDFVRTVTVNSNGDIVQ